MFDDQKFAGNSALTEHMSLFRDDGTLGTDDIDQHLELVPRLLSCVKRHNATLSDKKSFWFIKRSESLGHLVGQKEIVPTNKRISAL